MISRLSKFVVFGMTLFMSIFSTTAFAFTTRPTIQTFSLSDTKHTIRTTNTIRNMAGSPAVLDRPEVIEKVDQAQDTEKDERFDAGGWEIRLYNDPFNKREFVARCLSTICGKNDSESYQIMMQAHNNGMGVVGRYMFEVAELYYTSLQDNGLLVDMVPVEEE